MVAWVCMNCGWSPAEGDGHHPSAEGASCEELPEDWACPDCGAKREDFEALDI